MNHFTIEKVAADSKVTNKLSERGGFLDSLLADSDSDSLAFRRNFIRTNLERDIPQLGPRILAETLERFWTMLAHSRVSWLNVTRIASNLSISTTTVNRSIDLFVYLQSFRRLNPFHANVKKRLVKSHKIYFRDTGPLHDLLGIENFNLLSGHPAIDASWEGFVIENILASAPDGTAAL